VDNDEVTDVTALRGGAVASKAGGGGEAVCFEEGEKRAEAREGLKSQER